MAKGKRATALFEVMSQGKLPGRGLTPGGTPAQQPSEPAADRSSAPTASGPSILNPRWWFKSRTRADATQDVQPVTDTPGPTHQPPAAIAPRPVRSASATDQDTGPEVEDREDFIAVSPAPVPEPVALLVDRDRQQISLRLSYTSALIGGCGLLIVLGIAVLIGKSMSRGPAPAIANVSTPQVQKGPVASGVLNVSRRTADGASGTNDSVAGADRRTNTPVNNANGGSNTGGGNTARSGNGGTFNDPRPPATFYTDDPQRINGLNYAIIQSYPDKETADKAADFLTKHSIPCTVEMNLPGWRLPWPNGCVVVGTRGFPKVKDNPALEAYKKSITDLGIKFAGNRSRFNAFEPTMYRWNKSN